MAVDTARARLFRLFAEILNYPRSDIRPAVEQCQFLLSTESPGAEKLLRPFHSFIQHLPPQKQEEIYTRVFELNPVCHLYVGYHLFGESYKRSVFLLGLKERFHSYNFTAGEELPDHLTVLLRFLSICEDKKTSEELIQEAILPALDKMTKQNKPSEGFIQDGTLESSNPLEMPSVEKNQNSHPYLPVLQALYGYLQSIFGHSIPVDVGKKEGVGVREKGGEND